MCNSRIIGLIVLVVGVMLLSFGINATQSLNEQLSEGFTGRYTERTTWYLIGGTVLIVAGGVLSIFGGRCSTK